MSAVASGRGPLAVFVHGAAGDCRQWEEIAAALQSGYRAVRVSRRYHWPSPPPSAGAVYTYESHRDDLLVMLRAADHPVHLVGHSWGAGVALLAALSEPRLLRTLTLIEPPFASLLPPAAEGIDGERGSRGEMLEAIRSFARSGEHERATVAMIDWVQGGLGFGGLRASVQHVLLANARTTGPTFAAQPPAVTCDHLRGLRVPTYVLRGEHTRTWYRLIGEAVAACIPGAELAAVPAAAHMSIVENARAVARLIRAFLARH
jgi:pimeloyl-ACP methyl ester carboxylesterase